MIVQSVLTLHMPCTQSFHAFGRGLTSRVMPSCFGTSVALLLVRPEGCGPPMSAVRLKSRRFPLKCSLPGSCESADRTAPADDASIHTTSFQYTCCMPGQQAFHGSLPVLSNPQAQCGRLPINCSLPGSCECALCTRPAKVMHQITACLSIERKKKFKVLGVWAASLLWQSTSV